MNDKKIYQGFRINSKLVDLITKYATKNKTSRTQIVEYALIEYFKSKNEDIF